MFEFLLLVGSGIISWTFVSFPFLAFTSSFFFGVGSVTVTCGLTYTGSAFGVSSVTDWVSTFLPLFLLLLEVS